MLAPPFFNPEFADDDGTPLAGGFLYTYVSGTTTPLATYTDSTGDTENENPIELDAAGRCSLWLAEDAVYTFVIKRADLTTVRTLDGVSGCAAGSNVVTSVNDLTGAVELTADEIPFTTGTSTTWFAGVDVSAALDSIITQVNGLDADLGGLAITAADVSIADAGSLITATNVETALQEIAAKTLPSQSGNSGKFLTTNGTAASWGNASLPTFTATVTSGNITTSVSAGQQTYGTREVAVTGGTSPYTYQWCISMEGGGGFGQVGVASTGTTRAASITVGGYNDGAINTASVSCLVTDATGRVTTASFLVTATHAAGA